MIRRKANTGDWIVGTGSARKRRSGYLVFVMRVSEVLSFEQYWNDQRFLAKRPAMNGSTKVRYGDNIYHRATAKGMWVQEPSHHSLSDGKPNAANIKHDTQTDRVLVGHLFTYWGGSGPRIPAEFRGSGSKNICATRGHKNGFSEKFEQSFVSWYQSLNTMGYTGEPTEW